MQTGGAALSERGSLASSSDSWCAEGQAARADGEDPEAFAAATAAYTALRTAAVRREALAELLDLTDNREGEPARSPPEWVAGPGQDLAGGPDPPSDGCSGSR